jgi:hypothetical protein
MEQRGIKRPKTAEMKFMIRTAGCSSLDQRRSEDLVGPEVDPVCHKLPQYKQICLNHVTRMEDIRCP